MASLGRWILYLKPHCAHWKYDDEFTLFCLHSCRQPTWTYFIEPWHMQGLNNRMGPVTSFSVPRQIRQMGTSSSSDVRSTGCAVSFACSLSLRSASWRNFSSCSLRSASSCRCFWTFLVIKTLATTTTTCRVHMCASYMCHYR